MSKWGLVARAALLTMCLVSVICEILRPARAASLPPAEPPPEPVLQAGCDWVLAYDPAIADAGNTAYPETNARYYVAVIGDRVPAGSTLRLEGRYPDARYSAFHVYDGNAFFHDALADSEIAPDRGSVRRNLDRTRLQPGDDYGGAYTAFVKLGVAPPPLRAPNTAYRKPAGLLDGQARRRTLIAYRTYLPRGDSAGRVPLPALTLETPDGRQTRLPDAADASACATLARALVKANGNAVGEATGVSLLQPAVPELRPRFRKFDPTLLNALGLGVGYNPHNDFMQTKGDARYGEVLLVRGRLPSYTSSPIAPPAPQLRYWSICENGAASTRVYGCLADERIAVDAEGYYTVAISRDDAAPAALTAARGFNWLAWGPEPVSLVSIRELLARPDFAESIGRAPALDPASTRAGYMPIATYCSRATLQQYAPLGAREAFAMCQATR